MSRCGHMQSEYKLHELPKCSKCKIQFQLVMARYKYDNSYELIEEWECPKCNKHYPKNKIKEEKLSKQDQRLHEWTVKEQKKDATRKKRNKK